MSIIAYDAGKLDGRTEMLAIITEKLNEISKNPPMRGDIALNDLRLELEKIVP